MERHLNGMKNQTVQQKPRHSGHHLNRTQNTLTMSVNDWEVKNNLFQVSPNPATDYFQISGVEFNQLSLYDMNGRMITQSKQNTVSTSNIPSGVYFLKIDTNQHGTISKKIIVK